MRVLYHHTPVKHGTRVDGSVFTLPTVRATFAGIYVPKLQVLTIGAARCCAEDNYCRKTGRERAYERADITPISVYYGIKSTEVGALWRRVVEKLKPQVLGHSEAVAGVPLSVSELASGLDVGERMNASGL